MSSVVVFLLAQILYNKDIPFSIQLPKEPNSRKRLAPSPFERGPGRGKINFRVIAPIALADNLPALESLGRRMVP